MMKLLTILTLLVGSLFGATFNVSTTLEFRQALLDAAQNGQDDVIYLASGTYNTTDDTGGTFTFLDDEDHKLTIQGSGKENTFLSGGNHQDLVLRFQVVLDSGYNNIALKNLSVTDGNGGIYTQENLEISECNILSHEQLPAVDFYGGQLRVSNSEISDNNGSRAVNIQSGSATHLFQNTMFQNNTSGAIYSNKSMTINSCNFLNNSINYNSTNYNGAAILIESYGSSLSVSNSTFIGNNTPGDGGAIGSSYYSSPRITISDTLFQNNQSGSGGAIYSRSATLEKVIADGNIASSGSFLYATSSATIKNSIIKNHTSPAPISSSSSSAPSSFSSAPEASSSSSSIVTEKSSVYIASSPVIENTIFIDNEAGLKVSGESAQVLNSLFINNTLYDIIGTTSNDVVRLEYNYLDTSALSILWLGSNNNTDRYLGFVDEGSENYRLALGSGLIDSGTSGSTSSSSSSISSYDLDGNPRISGSEIDIGPYEYQYSSSSSGGSSSSSAPTNPNLNPPYNIRATKNTSLDTITVTWNEYDYCCSTGPDSYTLLRNGTTVASGLTCNYSSSSSSSGVVPPPAGGSTSSACHYHDTGLTSGSTYQYTLKSCNDYGCSEASDETDNSEGSTAATVLTASDGTYTDKVLINWNSVNGADEYLIYRNDTLLSIVSNLSYEDITINTGTQYSYNVQSNNASGFLGLSTTDQGFAAAVPYYPYPFDGSRGTVAEGIKLSWGERFDAVTYDLYRGESIIATINAEQCAKEEVTYCMRDNNNYCYNHITASSCVYTDTSVQKNQYYDYSVRGCNIAGCGSKSNQSMLYRGTTSINASDNKYSEKINITWGSVVGTEYYILYRSTSPMDDGYENGETIYAGPNTNFIDTDVIENEVYYYRVQFFDGTNVSEFLSAQDSGVAGDNPNKSVTIDPSLIMFILD